MDPTLDPLLPAFYLLWKAAMAEPLKNSNQDCVNANASRAKQTRTNMGVGHTTGVRIQQQSDSHTESRAEHIKKMTVSDETVVVCTLECDQGSKFVKQIISRGANTSVWSRSEDLFVDWLNSELTSQHAEQVDITVYLCRIPMSTTSDGIRLWMENLRAEGKEVTMKLRVASLSPLLADLQKEQSSSPRQRRSSGQENEAKETVRALKCLINKGANVEAISTGDWMQLITLLTDRSSLQALDLKRSPCSAILASSLEGT